MARSMAQRPLRARSPSKASPARNEISLHDFILALGRYRPRQSNSAPRNKGVEVTDPGLSQYTAARKVHEFHMLDLSANDKDEAMRKASLIYAS